MGFVVAQVPGGSFSGTSNSIKRGLIDPSIEYIQSHAKYTEVSGGKHFDRSSRRIDITDEKRNGQDLVKIQVQSDRNTYASVMIYQSAINACTTNPADDAQMIQEIANAINLSYENQEVYGITFT